jgi:hypothetical protein
LRLVSVSDDDALADSCWRRLAFLLLVCVHPGRRPQSHRATHTHIPPMLHQQHTGLSLPFVRSFFTGGGARASRWRRHHHHHLGSIDLAAHTHQQRRQQPTRQTDKEKAALLIPQSHSNSRSSTTSTSTRWRARARSRSPRTGRRRP